MCSKRRKLLDRHSADGRINCTYTWEVSEANMVRHTIFVLLICVLIRLVVMIIAAPWTPETEKRLIGRGDPSIYHALGVSLSEGRGYYRHKYGKVVHEETLGWAYPGEPEVLWPPGYSAFLALNYRLFGVQLTSVVLMQILLSLIGCFFFKSAVEQLYGARAGMWAGLLYALDPVLIFLSNSIWSEALFIPLMSVSVYCLAAILASNTLTNRFSPYVLHALLGLTLGASTWVRVTTFPLLYALTIALGIWEWKRVRRLSHVALTVSALCLSFFAAIAPWCLRNFLLTGVWSFSTSGSYNLLVGLAATDEEIDALLNKAYKEAVRDGRDPRSLNPFDRAVYWRKVALHQIRTNYFKYLSISLKRWFVTLTTPGTSGWGVLLGVDIPQSDARSERLVDILREFIQKFTLPIGFIPVYSVAYLTFIYFTFIAKIIHVIRDFNDRYIFVILFLVIVSIVAQVNNYSPRGRTQAFLFIVPLAAAHLSNSTISLRTNKK